MDQLANSAKKAKKTTDVISVVDVEEETINCHVQVGRHGNGGPCALLMSSFHHLSTSRISK